MKKIFTKLRTPNETLSQHSGKREQKAVLYACFWLDPETFAAIIGTRSKVPFRKWHDALWYIQKVGPNGKPISTLALADKLGLSWQTTDNLRAKLERVIKEARVGPR